MRDLYLVLRLQGHIFENITVMACVHNNFCLLHQRITKLGGWTLLMSTWNEFSHAWRWPIFKVIVSHLDRGYLHLWCLFLSFVRVGGTPCSPELIDILLRVLKKHALFFGQHTCTNGLLSNDTNSVYFVTNVCFYTLTTRKCSILFFLVHFYSYLNPF